MLKSIQSRLTTGLLISLLTIFISLWLLVSESIQELAESFTASRLHHDVETLLSGVYFDQHGMLQLNQERINLIYKQPFSGHYYSIQYQQHQLRSRSLWDQALKIGNTVAGKYTHIHQNGPVDQPLIIVSSQFSKQGYQFSISVAEDLTPLILDIEKFKNMFALISIIALVLLLIIQIFILRKGLKPLEEIKIELIALDQGKIAYLSSDVPKELKPLADEINHLLIISHKRLKRSRDALADLSHAIKKPLTVLHHLTDKKENVLESDSIKIINAQVQDIQQLTDRILKRARLSGNIHTGALFDFNSDFLILIKTIGMMYPNKKIEIKTNVPEIVYLHIDREDMLELLGNLLDNAYKWA
ncbi:MAG: HAMP domain-containing sensor histidine kinase, partial [Pseudomonadota bacterium]